VVDFDVLGTQSLVEEVELEAKPKEKTMEGKCFILEIFLKKPK